MVWFGFICEMALAESGILLLVLGFVLDIESVYRCMAKGSNGLPKVSLGPTKSYPSMPCG
jgi:hypothetical protein